MTNLKPHELLDQIYTNNLYYFRVGDFINHMRKPLFVGGYTLSIVYRDGSGDGEGEHVENVIMIEKDDYVGYVMVTGFYTSDDDTIWDDPDEWFTVEPREVVVTEYVPVDFTTSESTRKIIPISPHIEPHTCPYAEEIHGDKTTLCECDDERTKQCAHDI